MRKSEFERFKLKFSAEEDPVTEQPIDLEFDSTSFRRLEGSASKALYKIAA